MDVVGLLATLQAIHDELTEVKVETAKANLLHEQNAKSLEHHIKRTDLLEQEIRRVEKPLTWLVGTAKLIGIVGLLVAIATGIKNLL